MSQKDIFQNFEGAQNRKISSAPAGGSVPSSPVPSSSAKNNLQQNQSSTTPNSKDVIAYASTNPSTETTRCADAFTEEQRKVMARFSNNSINGTAPSTTATMTRNKAMEMLLNKDRSRTSLLVAELRKDAERMRKNEERTEAEQNDDDDVMQGRRGKSSSQSPNQNARHASPAFSNNKGAVASSCDDDAKEIGNASSPFDDFDESQLGRFSSLALESGAKQRLLEKCKRVEAEEKAERQHLKEVEIEDWKIVVVEIQFEMKTSLDFIDKNGNNNKDHMNEGVNDAHESNNEEDIISEIMSRTSPTSKDDGEAITMYAKTSPETEKSRNENSSNTAKRVTFSHLSSRRAGKMTEDAAAKIIQRQIRRFSTVASSQRFLALLHLSNICASENKNTTTSSFHFSSAFPYGSVCSCPTTAKWLRNGNDGKSGQKHQQKFSLACSSQCKFLPYHLQCLLAAALEYEVRLHSENLSQFYIAAEEEQARKNRKGAKVSRINNRLDEDNEEDENQQDGEESNNNNNKTSKRSHHHSFRIFRKCLLPNEEAEEILNMIKTAVSGEEFYLKKLSSKSGINEEQVAISSGEDDDDTDEDEQNHNNEATNNDVSKLAARWVVDSLIPFSSQSVCKILGGSKSHETALDLIFSKKNDKSQQQLVFYDTKSNSISNEINQNAEDKENSNPMKKSKSKEDNSRSSSIVAKLTGCTTYFLSLPTTGGDEWTSHENNINNEEGDDDAIEKERQREGMLEKMEKWKSTNDNDNKKFSNNMNHDLSKLMHIVPDESKSLVVTINNTNENLSASLENSIDNRKSTVELLEELRIDQEKLVASLPPVEGADNNNNNNNSSSSVVKRWILSDDERSLLQDLGDDDPVIAEMLEHIENAEDEELRASQAEIDRKLSFALAIQKAAQANLKRMTAVSTGCGGDDDDDQGNDDVVFNEREGEENINNKNENKNTNNGKWLPVNDQVRKFGAVITTSAVPKISSNENSKATNVVVKSMICVVCELDDDDTEKCQCGNYFHKDCGVLSIKNQSLNCCESCGKH